MSSFTQAKFERVVDANGRHAKNKAGRYLWRVCEAFYWELGFEGSGNRIWVPKGFVTDGPSIPPALAWLIPRGVTERAMLSACVHDMLREDDRYSLEDGNEIFRFCMIAEGTPAFWREVFYHAIQFNKSRTKHNEQAVYDAMRGGG